MHPVIFKIGSFELRSFGLMMVIAFFAGITLAQVRASRYGIKKESVADMSIWALFAGVLGARVVFILQDLPHYLSHPNELLTLRFEGLTSFGGLLFGLAAVLIWAKIRRVQMLSILDLTAPAFLIGHAVGRVGCLLNGCCFGGKCTTDVPWAIHVDHSAYLHHPAQIYDSLMNLAALGFLLVLERRGLGAGRLTALTLIFHGLTRFIYEFWRAGTQAQVDAGDASSTYWGSLPITQAQAMALVLVAAGLLMLAVLKGVRSSLSKEPTVA